MTTTTTATTTTTTTGLYLSKCTFVFDENNLKLKNYRQDTLIETAELKLWYNNNNNNYFFIIIFF